MVRNILAVIIGIIVGSVVNMGLVVVGSSLIPAPEGIDVNIWRALKPERICFKPNILSFRF